MLRKLLQYVVPLVLVGAFAFGIQTCVSWVVGRDMDKTMTRFTRETQGVNEIAAAVIRDHPNEVVSQLSEDFDQEARAWLAETYPSVTLEGAGIWESEGVYRVEYVLVDSKGARASARFTMDRDGNIVLGPPVSPGAP